MSDTLAPVPTDALQAQVVDELVRRGQERETVQSELKAARHELSEGQYRTALTYRLDTLVLSWDECCTAGRLLSPIEENVSR